MRNYASFAPVWSIFNDFNIDALQPVLCFKYRYMIVRNLKCFFCFIQRLAEERDSLKETIDNLEGSRAQQGRLFYQLVSRIAALFDIDVGIFHSCLLLSTLHAS